MLILFSFINTTPILAYGAENETNYSFVLDNNNNWNNKLRQIESISGKKLNILLKKLT